MAPFSVEHGRPAPLGASCDETGVNFALFSAHAERVDLCLFDALGQKEVARIPLPMQSEDVWHGYVPGLASGQRYGYRVYGPYEPRRGHRFNSNKLLIDPYTRGLDRHLSLAETQFGYQSKDASGDLGFDPRDDAEAMPKCIVVGPDQLSAAPTRPRIAWRDTVIYELHVRGISARCSGIAPAVRGKLAALSSPYIIAHLHDMGVTAVELMPIHAVADERHLVELGLHNYWGYNPIAFFALEPNYVAADGMKEFRQLVGALHEAGIELILDVVFNHSGESDEFGPTLSLRGIDNSSYYRLDAADPARYVNDSGCGNTLNVEHPRVRALILDALRYWAGFGVDGFRFDLAVTMAREGGEFRPDAAILSAMAEDPVLSPLKLIAEPWDVGPGGYRFGRFPRPFAQWNDRFRDCVRRYWRGDHGQVAELATRLTGSADFLHENGPLASINYVTAHDGFTLQDVVSYEEKHNVANGEDNLDGTDENFSANYGVEGPSDDASLRALRLQHKRNLIATLFVSMGVPMIAAGDELGHSQNGNNNAYCQDNETSWIDWRPLREDDAAFFRFVQRMIALRRDHPIFRRDRFLTGATKLGGCRDITWLRPDGAQEQLADWRNWNLEAFGALLCGPDRHGRDRHYLLMLNGGPQPLDFSLAMAGKAWSCLIDTSAADGIGTGDYVSGRMWRVSPRALIVLAEQG